jgi:Domain of unknown function (DUF4440)
MTPEEEEVFAAAQRRALALVRGSATELRQLMHPDLRWTTYRGAVLDRDAYIAGNTDGSVTWVAQQFEEPQVTVIGDTAILTAVVVDVIEREAERQTFRLRLTQVWVRESGEWRCAAGHAGPRLEE